MSHHPPEVLSPAAAAFQDLALEPEALQTVPRPTVDTDQPPQARQLRDVSPPRPAVIADTVSIVKFSDEVGELFGALATAQGKFGDVERTLTAKVQSRKEGGANYEYEYETLRDVVDAIRGPLSENGIAVMQFPSLRGGNTVLVRTMLGHKSGQWMYNDLTATIVGTDPQAVGTGITYIRRYALKAIVSVAAGWDDDGAMASQPAPRQAPQPAARRSQAPAPQAAAAPKVEPPAAPAAPAPPATATPSNIGTIDGLAARDGVTFVMLNTGYKCATKDATLAETLAKMKREGKRVELGCRKPKPGFAPTLEQILVADQA